MSQDVLFPDPTSLGTKVILRRKDFDGLFEGFTKLRAVSYVVSPDLLLDFFDRRGYTELEVVVGENLSERYRQELAQKGADVTERLAALMARGALRILVPDRTLHTKLYLLERPGQCRVIATSANLTETARQATRQVNYAWYADLPPGHPLLARVEADYRAHVERCSLFMGDLAELLRKEHEEKRRELVEAWLKSVPPEEVELETRRLLREIARRSVEAGTAEPVFTVQLPETPAARKEAERMLAPLNPLANGSAVSVNGRAYLRYVQENHGIPVLAVDAARREVRLGMDGEARVLTEPPPSAQAVGAALEHVGVLPASAHESMGGDLISSAGCPTGATGRIEDDHEARSNACSGMQIGRRVRALARRQAGRGTNTPEALGVRREAVRNPQRSPGVALAAIEPRGSAEAGG